MTVTLATSLCAYIYIFMNIYMQVSYNDRTVLPHWNVSKGKYPQITLFQLSALLLFSFAQIYPL